MQSAKENVHVMLCKDVMRGIYVLPQLKDTDIFLTCVPEVDCEKWFHKIHYIGNNITQ